MKTLIDNLDNFHTTPLGAVRIKRNIGLEMEDDVVEWCKQRTLTAVDIIRKGKNWYVYTYYEVITINAHSYTIITAHKR